MRSHFSSVPGFMSWGWEAEVYTFTSFGVGVSAFTLPLLKRIRKKKAKEERVERMGEIESVG